jgi:uncharacterized membrane protein
MRVLSTIGIGLLLVAPLYLALLLLTKALSSINTLLAPIVAMLPTEMQHASSLALLLILALGLVVGAAARTTAGQVVSSAIERSVLQRLPGYSVVRSLTRRIAGEGGEATWKPAVVDTDDGALMPVFVIEELADGRYTVFVPSVPTPLAGAVFVYQRDRVHLVDVPFYQALGVISRWGEGAKDLVAAMK